MKLPFTSHQYEKKSTDPKTKMLPLTPSYDESNHKVYFDAIEDSLRGEHRGQIRNIALSGGYGVGKSSILLEVANAHRGQVIQISLSTLGTSNDDAPSREGEQSITNRIQKEIVKQLLYREAPDKMPGSHFWRVGRFRKSRGLGVALIAAIPITLVFLLTGWTERIERLFDPYWSPGLASHLIVLVAATGFIWMLEAVAHNRIRIESLTAGTATITLSNGTATYFDQYLDEIVYFFEVTDYDIVIFEDIDRFDDAYIFESLRALNTLLNGAQQLRKKEVRFIYAIKDSIFDELGNRAARAELNYSDVLEDSELARANRTKFFDVVIPVVPFITHRSARDLLTRMMKTPDDYGVSDALIDLAARFVADMRLLKNVRNEYVIFRQKVLATDGGDLKLSEDSLFAMMLYKSTHLSDFELIKIGESQLDRFYRLYRQLIDDNIGRLNKELVECDRQLAAIQSIASRSEELGSILVSEIERLSRQLDNFRWNQRTVTFQNKAWGETEIRTSEFWEELAKSDDKSTLVVGFYDGRVGERKWTLSRSDVSQMVGDPLVITDWHEARKTNLVARRHQIREDVTFLARADIYDLIARDEFKLIDGSTLREQSRKYLKSELAIQLVAQGYINRDFTLYTSTYYSERVSTRAQNFILHNVATNIPDIYFHLEAADVDSIVREQGESVVLMDCMNNIDALDHLLKTRSNLADSLVERLASFSPVAIKFLENYFESGQSAEEVVTRLNIYSNQTIKFLISDATIGQPTQLRLVNAAFLSMKMETEYAVDEPVRLFIEKNYADLPAFTSDDVSPDIAQKICKTLANARVRLVDISVLGGNVRQEIVAESAYKLSLGNLDAALGGSKRLALDQIFTQEPKVYDHTLNHLPDYLAAIHERGRNHYSIEDPKLFPRVVADVHAKSSQLLEEVLVAADPACRASTLSEFPEPTWPTLALVHRMSTTLENVKNYLTTYGDIDAALAGQLVANGSISTPTDASEQEKVELARKLLAAKDVLPDPSIRVALIKDLKLTEKIDSTLVEPEEGLLIGLLISQEVLEDSRESFATLVGLSWTTREFAISKSKQFASFMSPHEVPPEDVEKVFLSTIVPDQIKLAILQRDTEFVPEDEPKSLAALATFANSHHQQLSIDLVTRMAAAGVSSRLVIQALAPILPSISQQSLLQILDSLGAAYTAITHRNGKRPRIPNDTAHASLAKKLEEIGIAASSTSAGKEIVINLRKS